MKISKLAKDTAKRIADNLSRGGHSLYMADLMSMETAIQGVIDHVQSGGFTGAEIAPDLDSQNDFSEPPVGGRNE